MYEALIACRDRGKAVARQTVHQNRWIDTQQTTYLGKEDKCTAYRVLPPCRPISHIDQYVRVGGLGTSNLISLHTGQNTENRTHRVILEVATQVMHGRVIAENRELDGGVERRFGK